MSLKSQLVSDMSVFFASDEFAETISYTPKDGAVSNIVAIVDKSSFRLEPYVRGPETATCIITVKAGDVTNPAIGDIFTFDGSNWEFEPGEGVILDDGYVFEIALRRID